MHQALESSKPWEGSGEPEPLELDLGAAPSWKIISKEFFSRDSPELPLGWKMGKARSSHPSSDPTGKPGKAPYPPGNLGVYSEPDSLMRCAKSVIKPGNVGILGGMSRV